MMRQTLENSLTLDQTGVQYVFGFIDLYSQEVTGDSLLTRGEVSQCLSLDTAIEAQKPRSGASSQ